MAETSFDPVTLQRYEHIGTQGRQQVVGMLWDTVALAFVVPTAGGSGGGSGSVTVTNFPAIQAVSITPSGAALAPATASVSGVSTAVLAANASRKKLVVVNIGTTNVFFGDGTAAALNSGIVLTPNGTWVMDSYTFTTNALYAICASSSILSIQEYQ